MRRLAVVLAVAAVLLAGCGADQRRDLEGVGPFVQRWSDDEYQVMCWESASGLACLPESEVLPR